MSDLFHLRMIDGEETNYQLGYQPQPTRSLNPPLRLKLLSDKIYISHNGNLSGAYYQTASSPFIWPFYLSCRIRISAGLSIPNLIQPVLPRREGWIVVKLPIHLQAFVGQQATFGEQLQGDTLQESTLRWYLHLQRETVIHGSVGFAVRRCMMADGRWMMLFPFLLLIEEF